jgi:hypothetical protein
MSEESAPDELDFVHPIGTLGHLLGPFGSLGFKFGGVGGRCLRRGISFFDRPTDRILY